MPRALLISLRDPHDPMGHHERRCFAERAELALDQVDVHPMMEGRPDYATLRRYDAIFFGGSGAYSVLDDEAWIRAGIDLCLEVVGLRIPAWASCFGFQGLALALGGSVVHDESRTEMGSTALQLTKAGRQDPLLGALPERFWAQEGHHDHVESLPDGVCLLSVGTRSHYQAFRVEGAPFWASQFHPELTVARTVERFEHYQDHYLASQEASQILDQLRAGADTDEMGTILPRLVRHEF